MTPPLIAFPLFDAIYENTQSLLAGQRETFVLLTSLISIGETIMATQAEGAAALQSLHTELVAAFKRESDAIVAWQKSVADLIAAGGTFPDALLTQVNADIAAAKAAVPALPVPPVTTQEIPQ